MKKISSQFRLSLIAIILSFFSFQKVNALPDKPNLNSVYLTDYELNDLNKSIPKEHNTDNTNLDPEQVFYNYPAIMKLKLYSTGNSNARNERRVQVRIDFDKSGTYTTDEIFNIDGVFRKSGNYEVDIDISKIPARAIRNSVYGADICLYYRTAFNIANEFTRYQQVKFRVSYNDAKIVWFSDFKVEGYKNTVDLKFSQPYFTKDCSFNSGSTQASEIVMCANTNYKVNYNLHRDLLDVNAKYVTYSIDYDLDGKFNEIVSDIVSIDKNKYDKTITTVLGFADKVVEKLYFKSVKLRVSISDKNGLVMSTLFTSIYIMPPLNARIGSEQEFIVDDENNNQSFSFYPNPSNSYISIDNSNIILENVEIKSSNGIVIERFDKINFANKIDVSGYKSGMYFISYEIDGRPCIKKIVVVN